MSTLLSPRIRIKPLAGLCRRLATVLGAGIDLRTAWKREADRVSGRVARGRFGEVGQAIAQGDGLAEALSATDDYFPPLFCELVDVGEQTGHLSEVLAQLADHYQDQVQLRRTFLAAIAWPAVQLSLAVVIVGFLIWIMGPLGERADMNLDPSGIGLVGTSGLLIYWAVVTAIAISVGILIRAAGRGALWTRPIQRAALRVPLLGSALQTIALARLAWSLNLTMQTGMEVRRAMRLCLRSTRNARYVDLIEPIDAEIEQGNSIHDAFLATGVFPDEFLDTLAVGEQSGQIAESMAALSQQYQARAKTALATLTMLAGFAVWGVVAMILILLIFRTFSFYVGIIQEVTTW